jgi:prophage tail gpP-like protein
VSGDFTSAAAVELRIGGQRHVGWRAMKMTTSLDAPAAKCSLELAERWAMAEDAVPRDVKPGAACQLILDGEMVLDGHIDAVEVQYDERDHVLTCTVRDKLGDLVDCAAVLDGPHEWRGLRLDEIAERLARPYGVAIRREAEPGPPFPRFAIQPGETAWEALERAAKARGVLLAGTGTGVLRLTRASLAPDGAGPIELGQNVRRVMARFDHAERFSVVCVRGQGEGGRQGAGVHAGDGAVTPGAERLLAARGEARATDPAIRRHRPRVIVAEAAGDAPAFRDRAAWEVRHAAGQGTRVAYTVPGWRGARGALWRIGTMVPVTDAWLGAETELLVATVLFSLTAREGSLTEVELTLPDAYDVLPVPLKDRGGAGGQERGLFDVTGGQRRRLELPPA